MDPNAVRLIFLVIQVLAGDLKSTDRRRIFAEQVETLVVSAADSATLVSNPTTLALLDQAVAANPAVAELVTTITTDLNP